MIGWARCRELINRCYMSRCLHKMKIRFLSVISLVVKKSLSLSQNRQISDLHSIFFKTDTISWMIFHVFVDDHKYFLWETGIFNRHIEKALIYLHKTFFLVAALTCLFIPLACIVSYVKLKVYFPQVFLGFLPIHAQRIQGKMGVGRRRE